jgi:hypothetical protein
LYDNAPFEGMSTQKAHYIQHGLQPTRSYKPDNTAFQSGARFEDGTMYRQDYVPKPRPPCPCLTWSNRYIFRKRQFSVY